MLKQLGSQQSHRCVIGSLIEIMGFTGQDGYSAAGETVTLDK